MWIANKGLEMKSAPLGEPKSASILVRKGSEISCACNVFLHSPLVPTALRREIQVFMPIFGLFDELITTSEQGHLTNVERLSKFKFGRKSFAFRVC
jgi:hypothetical protein